jgi:tetratricopeptide (TPR) repeat protein
VLDIQAELQDAGQSYPDLYESVADLKRRYDLKLCSVQPQDSLCLRNDADREAVQDLLVRFRRLPDEARRQLPALLNSLGQLQVVVGDFASALQDFQEAGEVVEDRESRAEIEHNIYRTSLELRQWEGALSAIKRAMALNDDPFEPFPFNRYQPVRILGAGGFGTVFLCRDLSGAGEVVVRTLRMDSLDRDLGAQFRDFKTMRDLEHPALARVLDYARSESEPERVFVVSEFVSGTPLNEIIAERGPFTPADWLPIAWFIARALQTLHGRGTLHRCLRPSCIMLMPWTNRDGNQRFVVKVLDATLGYRRAVVHACAGNADSLAYSVLGRGVSRALGYSAPEVVSRPKGQVWVAPHSDIYSFGRLCFFALTGKPNPDDAARGLIPPDWLRLLDECVSWTINRRPSHVGLILDRLALLGGDEQIKQFDRDLHDFTLGDLTTQIEANDDDAELYIRRSDTYLRQGENDKALEDLNQAVEMLSDDAALLRKRARLHARTNHEAAIADYTESLKIEPSNHEALTQRGFSYATLEKHQEAITDFTDALKIHSKDDLVYYHRGNSWYFLGNYERAIADYSESLRLNPQALWALGNRGKAYLFNREPARAASDFSRVLTQDPNNLRALCDRAEACLNLRHYDKAIADYSAALRLLPSSALYHDRALAYANAGKFAEAIADFTESIKLSPENAATLLSRARAFAENEQFAEAHADLEHVLQIAPQSIAAFQQRAGLFFREGKIEECFAELAKALEIQPENASVLFQRGNFYAELDKQQEAINDFTEVIRLDPNSSGAFNNRANSYARLNDAQRALQDFDEAITLDPRDTLTYLNRASTHLRLGNTEQSLADYSQALRLDPANLRAYSNRGLILSSRGEFAEALADFDQALKLDPNNPRILNSRGNARAELGRATGVAEAARVSDALQDFDAALRVDPSYILARYNRGIARLDLRDFRGSIDDLNQVIEVEADNATAWMYRGIAKRRAGDTLGAILDLTASLELSPEMILALIHRSRLYMETKQYEAALADLQTLTRINPKDTAAYMNMGRVHTLRGDHLRAMQANLAGLEQSPDDQQLLNNLAWLWSTAPSPEIRDPQRALEFALRACALGIDSTNQDTLAAAYAVNGDFAKAVETQEKAIELAPDYEKEDFRSRLDLYREGKFYIQPSLTESERGEENDAVDAR